MAYCDHDGMGYIPFMDAMCSGYDKNEAGEHTVTVAFEGYSNTFIVAVNKSGGPGGAAVVQAQAAEVAVSQVVQRSVVRERGSM